MNTAIVLRKAAWIIEQRGWTRWTFVDGDGSVCAYAAIANATPVAKERTAARQAVERLVGHPIVVWNAAYARDAEDVIATLRKAGEAT